MRGTLLLYFIAFCEGFVVLALEITLPHLIAPYFGVSIGVWTSTLVVTLAMLALGYYTGGLLTKKPSQEKILATIITVCAVYTAISGIIYKRILDAFIDMPLVIGSIISLLLVGGPVLLGMGCLSPILVAMLYRKKKQAGKASGVIFAVSTVGSIAGGALSGYVLLPFLGIKNIVVMCALILAINGIIVGLRVYSAGGKIFLIIALLVAFFALFRKEKGFPGLIYTRDTIHGRITVYDFSVLRSTGVEFFRALSVNGVNQSLVYRDNPSRGYWLYIRMALHLIKKVTGGKGKALIIGLGAGTLAWQMAKLGLHVHSIEISKDIYTIARTFFAFPDSLPVTIADAVPYLRRNPNRWDVIFIDAFLSEEPPHHLFTLERFTEMKRMLTPSGAIIINFYGFTHGKPAMPLKYLYSTLVMAGYNVFIVNTNPARELEANNLLVCTLYPFYMPPEELEEAGMPAPDPAYLIVDTTGLFSPEKILRDDYPVLPFLVRIPAKMWREGYLRFFIRQHLKSEA